MLGGQPKDEKQRSGRLVCDRPHARFEKAAWARWSASVDTRNAPIRQVWQVER